MIFQQQTNCNLERLSQGSRSSFCHPKNWAKTDARAGEPVPNLDWILCALTAGLAIFLSWLTVAKLVGFPVQLAHGPTVRITDLFQQTNVRQPDDQPEEKATSHIDRRKKIRIPSFSTCPFMAIGCNMANVEASSSTFPFPSGTSLPPPFFKKISNAHQSPKTDLLSVYQTNSASANYTRQLPCLAVVCHFPFN